MRSYQRVLFICACIVLSVACSQKTPQNKASAPPPPEVTTVTAHTQTLPLTRELVGRLAATRVAEVRARVAGIILHRVYTEGTDVEPGQTLFQIDPAPLEADLHAAEAALAKAEADATNAALTAKRYKELAAKKLLSSQDLDSALANERTTAAAVKEAQANVEKTRLDLGYATVTAPIAGRAGRALVTEGALVGQGEATKLTTIEQIDPIYVNFSLSVSELQELHLPMSPGNGGLGDRGGKAVELVLPNGKTYAQRGTLDYSDTAVDPGTGAVSLRAVVPNPEHRLLPGMFVNLRLILGQLDNAYQLPQASLSRDTEGAYLLVVDADGKVQKRRVETHGMTRSDWIVTGSLQEGDKVIVEGLQKVQPGAVAKAVSAAKPEG
jgi:membrane fusion protein (multidrug efflux system)